MELAHLTGDIASEVLDPLGFANYAAWLTCGSDSDDAEGLSSLVTITAEPAGANCPSGGNRIDTGLDDNGDGVLAADEEGVLPD